MKTIKSLFFLSLLFLISCGDDPFSEELMGTWDLLSWEVTGCNIEENNLPFRAVGPDNCIEIFDLVCDVRMTFLTNDKAAFVATADGEIDIIDMIYTTNNDTDSGTIYGGMLCGSDSTNGIQLSINDEVLIISGVDENDNCNIELRFQKN